MTGEHLIDQKTDGPEAKTLSDAMLIGIGNDGRSDDGLGWEFLNAIKRFENFHGPLAFRFQLQIEDAETISHANQVVFVDACRHPLPNGCQWQKCKPVPETEYTSHQLSPQTVLYLCQQLYGTSPAAYLLLIEGVDWGLQFGLSKQARTNLDSALRFFTGLFE